MKKTAYWHVYLTENQSTWASIVMEQLGLMDRSGLLGALDEFNVSVIYRDRSVRQFNSLVSSAYPTADIEFVENPYKTDLDMLKDFNSLRETENRTMQRIWENSKNDENVLYFHTKGVTADLRFLEGYEKFDPTRYRSYYYWRQFLNWGVLRQWQCCVAGLKDADVVGPNLRQSPEPHFSGNFWWAKASHIQQLPDPAKDDWWQAMQAESDNNWFKSASKKHKDEFWVTSNKPEVIDLAPGLDNPADQYLSPQEYWSKGC